MDRHALLWPNTVITKEGEEKKSSYFDIHTWLIYTVCYVMSLVESSGQHKAWVNVFSWGVKSDHSYCCWFVKHQTTMTITDLFRCQTTVTFCWFTKSQTTVTHVDLSTSNCHYHHWFFKQPLLIWQASHPCHHCWFVKYAMIISFVQLIPHSLFHVLPPLPFLRVGTLIWSAHMYMCGQVRHMYGSFLCVALVWPLHIYACVVSCDICICLHSV